MHRMWSSGGANFDHHLDNNSSAFNHSNDVDEAQCQENGSHLHLPSALKRSVHTILFLATISSGSGNNSALYVKATHTNHRYIYIGVNAAWMHPFYKYIRSSYAIFGSKFGIQLNIHTMACMPSSVMTYKLWFAIQMERRRDRKREIMCIIYLDYMAYRPMICDWTAQCATCAIRIYPKTFMLCYIHTHTLNAYD